MAADKKRLSEAEHVGPTDRQSAKLDAARAISRRQQALLAAAGLDVPERRWFVLSVLTGKENAVDNFLESERIERWLPLAKFEKRHRPERGGTPPEPTIKLAWPGYIFVRVVNSAEVWHGLATIGGVTGVLGTALRPLWVSDEKVSRYKYQLEHDEVARKALINALEPGEQVKFPLARNILMTGEVKAIREDDRVSVEYHLFGRACVSVVPLAEIVRAL